MVCPRQKSSRASALSAAIARERAAFVVARVGVDVGRSMRERGRHGGHDLEAVAALAEAQRELAHALGRGDRREPRDLLGAVGARALLGAHGPLGERARLDGPARVAARRDGAERALGQRLAQIAEQRRRTRDDDLDRAARRVHRHDERLEVLLF